MLKKAMALLLVLCLLLGLVPSGTNAQAAERSIAVTTVKSEAELLQALDTVGKWQGSDNSAIIEVEENITITETVVFPQNKQITLRSAQGKRYTISADSGLAGNMFEIPRRQGDGSSVLLTRHTPSAIMDAGGL